MGRNADFWVRIVGKTHKLISCLFILFRPLFYLDISYLILTKFLHNLLPKLPEFVDFQVGAWDARLVALKLFIQEY